MRGRPAHKSEKYMFISDHQIPDQDDRAIALVNKIMADYAPDKLFIVGDLLDFKKISKHKPQPKNRVSLAEEIRIGRRILGEHIAIAKKANSSVEIHYIFGNHEQRLDDHLAQVDPDLEDLEIDGEYINSIPHLLQLKKLGVKWYPYKTHHIELHGLRIEHGSFVRPDAGATALKHVRRRNMSVVHGHTHRGGLVFERVGHSHRFGMELGCLCKLNLFYAPDADFIHGFGIIYFNKETNQLYPQFIPIINYSCVFEGKLYAG